MKKISVVYWSGTGNTEQMANAVADGARKAGAQATLLTPAEFDGDKVKVAEGKDGMVVDKKATVGLIEKKLSKAYNQ